MNKFATRIAIGGLICLGGVAFVGCIDTSSYQYWAMQQGMKQFKAGDYATAAGSFQDALRHEPRLYQAQYYLAASHDALNMHQQAVSEYKAALAVMKTTVQGRHDQAFRYKVIDALAHSIASGSDLDSQIEELKKNAAASNSAEDNYILAKVYQYAGDADSAITAYTKATLLAPSNAKYAKDFGLYLERVGQTGKAEKELRTAWSLGDRDKEISAALQRMGSVNATPGTLAPEPVQPKTPTGTSAAPSGPSD